MTVFQTVGGRWEVATADEGYTIGSDGSPLYTVSVYGISSTGEPSAPISYTTPLIPTRIFSADLTGDGLDDLVTLDCLDDRLQVWFQNPDGTFDPQPLTLTAGSGPSDVTFADLNADGPSIVVSDEASADVTVFLNDASHSFAIDERFRPGNGLFGFDSASGQITLLGESVSVVAGNFFAGGDTSDLAVVNRGTDSFSVLRNDGNGGFLDPQPSATTSLSNGSGINAQPGPIVAGYFFGPQAPMDLAILMLALNQVWTYKGNGDGTFVHFSSIDVGASPTGLSVTQDPETYLENLLVGNEYGDVLILKGYGNGTFFVLPSVTGNSVSLDVRNVNGQVQALVTNQEANLVTTEMQSASGAPFQPTQTLYQESSTTLPFAPAGARWLPLDEGGEDAVWVGTGSNSLYISRVDPATGDWTVPTQYFVGEEPVSVSMAYLNGTGAAPDLLVADKGSNDVYALFGSYDENGDWVGTSGPRQTAGGTGPIAATTRTLKGQTTPSMVITNADSGLISVFSSAGQGFFDDGTPRVLNIPGNPALAQGATFFGNSNTGVVLTTDGRIFQFNLDNFTAQEVFASPPGQTVTTLAALDNGELVVAEEEGTVAPLATGAEGYEAVKDFTPLSGIPSDPSALAVLETASGLEVLVTNQGEGDLFAYASGSYEAVSTTPFLAAESIVLPSPVSEGPMLETTAPSEAPLVLYTSVTVGVLSMGDPD